MGWEKRGNASYYYTAERFGGRVVKMYVGTGRVAELASQLVALDCDRRATESAAEKRDREAVAALAPLCELADAATAAALLAAGYHRPKRGKWRKRRG